MKCFKGIAEKAGEYERWKDYDIEVISMDDCGGCPGILMPKVAIIMDMGKLYDRDFDAIHLGTCIMKATQTAKCPIDVEDIKKKIETKKDNVSEKLLRELKEKFKTYEKLLSLKKSDKKKGGQGQFLKLFPKIYLILFRHSPR